MGYYPIDRVEIGLFDAGQNPVAYGGDPTGNADSTQAIQTAFNNIAPGGGRVYIPKGTFLISSAVTCKDNTVIEGEGTIMLASGANYNNTLMSLGNNCTLRGITIDGNYLNQASGSAVQSAVQAVAKTLILFDDLTIQNVWNNGIVINNGCSYVTVQNCVFNNIGLTANSSSAGHAVNCANAASSHIKVLNCFATNCGQAGTNSQVFGFGTGASDVTVLNNTIVNFPFIGIGLGTTGSHAVVAANYIDDTGFGSLQRSNSIDIGTWSDVVVSDNVIIGTYSGTVGGSGIANGPPNTNVIVTSNYIFGIPGAGINLGGGSSVAGRGRFEVSDNVIDHCANQGMALSDIIGLSVCNNICINNGQNTSLTTNSRTGIYFNTDSSGALTNVTCEGNVCYDDQASPTQQHAIFLNNNGGTAFSSMTIANNVVTGNVLSSIGTNNGGGFVPGTIVGTAMAIRGNPGYNPVGNLAATGYQPAVPASGTATAPTGVDATVYISTGAGVTISAVAIGGATITGLTQAVSSLSGPIHVPAGQTITLTYAGGTPTWQWFGD